jgi:Transcriptional regulators
MRKKMFFERLAATGKLTPNEKKLASLFERDYHGLAFDNLELISEKAGVSKSAVSRFIARLGYANFHIFIRELRDEVSETLDSPIKRHEKRLAVGCEGKERFLATHLDAVAANLRETAARLQEEDFARVLDVLCQVDRPLYFIGCATAEQMVTFFYLLMRYLRDNMTLLDGNAPTLPHRMGEITENAVLFSFAFSRYPVMTRNVMAYFHEKGSDVIFLTDRHTAPMLQYTTHPLVVHAEGMGMFNTRCSALAVMEALLGGMTARMPEYVKKRYATMREAFQSFNVYQRE